MQIPIARDLAERVAPFSSRTTCQEVFDRFMASGSLLNVPVVNDGRPVGMVSRQDFLLVYVRLYGREIYGRRPISSLMNRYPLVVDASESCEQVNARLFGSGLSSPLQGYIVTDNGTYFGLGAAATLMRVMAGLTERRAQDLERQRQRAEAANQSKTKFLATMSHELRTPLNAIIGFADLIRMELYGEMQPPRYREYIADIHNSGIHLLGMINELLDMAKIEAGRSELNETEIVVPEIVDEVVRMLRPSIVESGLTLSEQIEEDLPALFADEQQVRRILVNLVSNAVKFTPPQGNISVVAEVAENGGMRIAVQDTGIGIPADKLQKVLEPFEQVENSFTRTRAGTGLGLPLAKAMAEAHDGTLCLESEIGVGTTVCVCLPPSRLVTSVSDSQVTDVA